jgi:hypothetical protein
MQKSAARYLITYRYSSHRVAFLIFNLTFSSPRKPAKMDWRGIVSKRRDFPNARSIGNPLSRSDGAHQLCPPPRTATFNFLARAHFYHVLVVVHLRNHF